ncbi:MAG: replication factor C large subunit [Promethearchaeota archaeon]|nr:MAG: replication factor C large subunit [Candidatus Lokiarchaeota archaeon]
MSRIAKKKNQIEIEIPWVEKYRPKSMKDMVLPSAKVKGHRVDLAEELTNFVKNFFKEIGNLNDQNKKLRAYNRTVPEKEQKEEVSLPPEKAAVLLEGPPGIGKTSIVYALANDLNMDVIETNASDTRTREALELKLKETTKSRGIVDFITESKQKLILIDEVDGIYGTKDRGAVPAILELVENTQFPIIMCSNEYKQNLQNLYKNIQRFEVNPLPEDQMMRIGHQILKRENITNFKNEDLELIVKKNNGDLRGVINDLQGISQGFLEDDNKDLILSLHRDNTEEIFTLIRDLFQKVNTLEQARDLTDKSDVDYNFLYKWVNENLPTFLNANEDIAKAYENLSLADEIFGRIRKNQYWALLPYFYDLFAGGVALSRKKSPATQGFRRVVFPRYITSGSYSLSTAEKSIVEKINLKYEISQFEAIQNFVPFLRILCGSSRKQLKLISDWLDLNAAEKKILK